MSHPNTKITEKQAYNYIRQKGQEYIERGEKTRGARYMVAKTTIALFLAGLPSSVVKYFEPIERGDYIVVPIRRPRGFIHEYILTPEEAKLIPELIYITKQYYSEKSIDRVLQDERKRFLQFAGIEKVTSLDTYALKLRILGLGQLLRGRYPLRRLEFVLAYIAQAMEKSMQG
jgi:hypothetical protein